MSIIRKAKYKLSRRIGKAVWGEAKDPVNRKRLNPNGAPNTKLVVSIRKGDYGLQLQAKQTLKGYYGMSEKQFRRVFKEADNAKGETGVNLLQKLESRLVAFVYRANFAPTIFAARQLVSHKHITVNGKVVNIPSYRLKVGDVVSIKESSKSLEVIKESIEKQEREIPVYLELSENKLEAKYTVLPEAEDIPYPVEMEVRLIIEFYSR